MLFLLRWILFPGFQTHVHGGIPSPPFARIVGVPCLRLLPAGGQRQRAHRRPVLLFFHGNRQDLGSVWHRARIMANRTGHEVVIVEYRGYGVHPGPSDPSVIIADGIRVLCHLRSECATRKIHVAGYSIGTGVATEVVSRSGKQNSVSSLTLIAPFRSVHSLLRRYVSPDIASVLLPSGGIFNTAAHLATPYIRSLPKCIIHGKQDTLIPSDDSVALHSICQETTDLMIDESGDHERVSFERMYSNLCESDQAQDRP
jgi:pimeloyl-ACP methyl ester carboxylesterase